MLNQLTEAWNKKGNTENKESEIRNLLEKAIEGRELEAIKKFLKFEVKIGENAPKSPSELFIEVWCKKTRYKEPIEAIILPLLAEAIETNDSEFIIEATFKTQYQSKYLNQLIDKSIEKERAEIIMLLLKKAIRDGHLDTIKYAFRKLPFPELGFLELFENCYCDLVPRYQIEACKLKKGNENLEDYQIYQQILAERRKGCRPIIEYLLCQAETNGFNKLAFAHSIRIGNVKNCEVLLNKGVCDDSDSLAELFQIAWNNRTEFVIDKGGLFAELQCNKGYLVVDDNQIMGCRVKALNGSIFPIAFQVPIKVSEQFKTVADLSNEDYSQLHINMSNVMLKVGAIVSLVDFDRHPQILLLLLQKAKEKNILFLPRITDYELDILSDSIKEINLTNEIFKLLLEQIATDNESVQMFNQSNLNTLLMFYAMENNKSCEKLLLLMAAGFLPNDLTFPGSVNGVEEIKKRTFYFSETERGDLCPNAPGRAKAQQIFFWCHQINKYHGNCQEIIKNYCSELIKPLENQVVTMLMSLKLYKNNVLKQNVPKNIVFDLLNQGFFNGSSGSTKKFFENKVKSNPTVLDVIFQALPLLQSDEAIQGLIEVLKKEATQLKPNSFCLIS